MIWLIMAKTAKKENAMMAWMKSTCMGGTRRGHGCEGNVHVL